MGLDIYYWYPVDEARVAANHLIIHGTPPNSQELSSPKYQYGAKAEKSSSKMKRLGQVMRPGEFSHSFQLKKFLSL